MKHVFVGFLLAISVMLAIFVAPFADASILNPFGGRVILPKALQIQVLEATGFVCVIPGKTMEILPSKKSFPKSYFIPTGIKNKNNNISVTSGQSILGLYSIKTPIVCTNSASGATKTVNLSTVTMYGTSKK